MNNSFRASTRIGHSLGASVLASLGIMLVGACVFGVQFDSWTESEGRLVGAVGTILGVGSAVVGLYLASCDDAQRSK
jgi:hypothetical protein